VGSRRSCATQRWLCTDHHPTEPGAPLGARRVALWVWLALGELELDGLGPRTIADIVSCPGTDSCKLGITSSMGLNRAVSERIAEMAIDDPLTARIHVKMSGCPNGCAQHHVASIGFLRRGDQGRRAQRSGLHPPPRRHYEGGSVVMGHRLKARLPAKRVPEAVERWVRHYESTRGDGEEFNAFVDRVGTAQFEELVKDLTLPPEFSLESMNHFIDWSRSEPFEVVRGEGECAV